jgi:hypothetical protein
VYKVCYTFVPRSGVVQLVARQPLELVILVRVQAPEPFLSILRTRQKLLQFEYLQVKLLRLNCIHNLFRLITRPLPYSLALITRIK